MATPANFLFNPGFPTIVAPGGPSEKTTPPVSQIANQPIVLSCDAKSQKKAGSSVVKGSK
jgi:hypothetical protein